MQIFKKTITWLMLIVPPVAFSIAANVKLAASSNGEGNYLLINLFWKFTALMVVIVLLIVLVER